MGHLATVGNPLHQWPGISAGDMSDTDVIAIMALVVYFVWATFLLALLLELPTQLAAIARRRPARSVRIPLLGWQQGLARTLVTSVLMILPVAVTTFGPTTAAMARTPAVAAAQQHLASATAVPAAQPDSQRRPTQRPDDRNSHPGRVPGAGARRADHVLGGRRALPGRRHGVAADRHPQHRARPAGRFGNDQLRAAQARLVGAAARARQEGSPRHGRPPAGSEAEPVPNRPQHQVDVESPQQKPTHSESVTVHPDDTLSGIAADHGIKDWHEIWPENKDRLEPGGRHFTDPNLILPGWTVELPEHAAPPVAPPVTAHPPATSPPHASDRTQEHGAPPADRGTDG